MEGVCPDQQHGGFVAPHVQQGGASGLFGVARWITLGVVRSVQKETAVATSGPHAVVMNAPRQPIEGIRNPLNSRDTPYPSDEEARNKPIARPR